MLVYESQLLFHGSRAEAARKEAKSEIRTQTATRWKIIFKGPAARRGEVFYAAKCPEHTNDSAG